MQDVAGSGGGAAPCCACGKAKDCGQPCASQRAAKARGCCRALGDFGARPARPRNQQRPRAQAGAGRQSRRCACTCKPYRLRQRACPSHGKACADRCDACGSRPSCGSACLRKRCSCADEARGRSGRPRCACSGPCRGACCTCEPRACHHRQPHARARSYSCQHAEA